MGTPCWTRSASIYQESSRPRPPPPRTPSKKLKQTQTCRRGLRTCGNRNVLDDTKPRQRHGGLLVCLYTPLALFFCVSRRGLFAHDAGADLTIAPIASTTLISFLQTKA